MNSPLMGWAVFDGGMRISALYPSRRLAETLSQHYKEGFAEEGVYVELHVEGVNLPRRDGAVHNLGTYRELRNFISGFAGGEND